MTETVSDERLRELADETNHFVTAQMEMWKAGPMHSFEVLGIASELLALRTPPQNTDGEAVAWQHKTYDERTRKWSDWLPGKFTGVPVVEYQQRPLVPASALSAMKAERDAAIANAQLLGLRVDRCVRDAATAVAERDALAKALEPFAAFADEISRDHPGWDHDQFAIGDAEIAVPFRHFRRARSILQGDAK